MVRTQVVLAIALAGVIDPLAQARAQETSTSPTVEASGPCPKPWGSERVLGGHQFFVGTLVEPALTLTYAGVRAGLESEKITDVPFARLGPRDVSQLRVAEGVDLSVTIAERVDISVTGAGYAAAGMTVPGLLVRGMTYLYGAGGGLKVRLFETQDTALAVRVGGRYASGKVFNLRSFALSLTEAPVAALADIVTGDAGELLNTPLTTYQVNGAVALAHAFSPLLSLQADVGAHWERQRYNVFNSEEARRIDRDITETVPEAAVGLGIDFGALGVPIATLLEYSFGVAFAKNDILATDTREIAQTAAVGLFYSGRTDLQLGITGFWQFGLEPVAIEQEDGTVARSKAPQDRGGSFILRSFW